MNYKKQLVKFDISKIVNMSFLLFLIPAILGIAVNIALNQSSQRIFQGTILYDLLFAVALIVVSLFAHEGLHALGFIIFGKASPKDVKFGIIWKQGMLYCTTRTPLTAKAYSLSLVLPLIFTGIIPFIISVFLGNVILVLVFSFLISGAAGDVIMLNKVSSYHKNQLILDHPEAPAFYLIYEEGKEPDGFVEVTEEEERELLKDLTENPLKNKTNKSWAAKTIYVILFLLTALIVMFAIGVVLTHTV